MEEIIARFRCSNEEKANRFWIKGEERRCRICHKEEETLEHVLNEYSWTTNKVEKRDLLKDHGSGISQRELREEEKQ